MSPMEFLDQVIKSLPGEEAFNLKKELIISIVTGTDASHETLLGQKPTSFNPLAGSVTIPELKVSSNLNTPSYLQFIQY